MTDQPTGRFAALINAMTPGEWEAYPNRAQTQMRLSSTDCPVSLGSLDFYGSGGGGRPSRDTMEANAAGIIASVALARLMVSERAVEIMARATYGGPDWDFANQNIRDFRVQRARAAIAAILKEVEG
jgi:hypothetical protein